MTVVRVAFVLLLGGMLIAMAGAWFQHGEAVGVGGLISDLFGTVGAVLISLAIMMLILDRLIQRQIRAQEKAALILQMASPDNAFAVEAVRVLRQRRWLTDGSLRGAHLGDANLAGADLHGAQLEDTHLYQANLEGAILREANLAGAHLWQANLKGAHLEWAHLEGARLYQANLEGAVLEGAHLEGTHLERANLAGALLRGAHLEGAILEGAHLEGAHLEWAHLAGAFLQGAHLEGAYVSEEQLAEAETVEPAATRRGTQPVTPTPLVVKLRRRGWLPGRDVAQEPNDQ
ncbi:MAG: pentapeptide repeat-containing protein [Chloroflexota bacterium]|nr:pentapeptide repeat-containing protein [Chloroflexota bacterium]